jgi:hypothetical protein
MLEVPYLEKRLGGAPAGTLATAEDVGDLSGLKTVDKSCIVSAINEGLSAHGRDPALSRYLKKHAPISTKAQ